MVGVDAAAYVIWRKTDGTPESYDLWRTNFGRTVGSGAGASANAAVREPASLILMILAASVSSKRGPHRKSQQLM